MNKEELELIDGFFNKGWCCDLDEVYKVVMKLQQENKKLREKYEATNKGLRKVLSKRLKWKRRYYKEKHIRKELKKWLSSFNRMSEFAVWEIENKIKELEEGIKDESRNII